MAFPLSMSRLIQFSRHFFVLLASLSVMGLFQPLVSHAGPEYQAICSCDEADPFDPREEAFILEGRYKGQCQDSCHKRSVKTLDQAQSASYRRMARAAQDDLAIANVSHQRKFWVAFVSPDAVEKVILQLDRFDPKWVAGHIQLRLRFKKGQEPILVPQSRKSADVPVRLSDLVISDEYNAPIGVPYDPFKGFIGGDDSHFNINYRIASLEERFEDMVIKRSGQVEQFPLELNKREKRGILLAALRLADREGMSRLYNTWTKSCVTETYEVIDSVVDYEGRGIFRTPDVGHVPGFAEFDLSVRRIFRRSEKMPDLNVEFGYPL